MSDERLTLAGRAFTSRLLVGTGRYANLAAAKAAIAASGAEIVTVAVRRLNLGAPGETLHSWLEERGTTLLPNTAGAKTAEEALRLAALGRELSGSNLVKLEIVHGEQLLPHEEETLRAAALLAREGFSVMAYTTDSLDVARKLEDAGCAAVMPLAAPIGSGQGILYPETIRRIVDALACPVLVDAGIGTASDACVAMELGCAGVLLNTAIAEAKDPVAMARAMRLAVEAGRHAFLAGRMEKRASASASSPLVP